MKERSSKMRETLFQKPSGFNLVAGHDTQNVDFHDFLDHKKREAKFPMLSLSGTPNSKNNDTGGRKLSHNFAHRKLSQEDNSIRPLSTGVGRARSGISTSMSLSSIMRTSSLPENDENTFRIMSTNNNPLRKFFSVLSGLSSSSHFADSLTADQFALYVFKENRDAVKRVLSFFLIMNFVYFYTSFRTHQDDRSASVLLFKLTYITMGHIFPLAFMTFFLSHYSPTTSAAVDVFDRAFIVTLFLHLLLPLYEVAVGDILKVQLLYVGLTSYCSVLPVFNIWRRFVIIFSFSLLTCTTLIVSNSICANDDPMMKNMEGAESITVFVDSDTNSTYEQQEREYSLLEQRVKIEHCPMHCESCTDPDSILLSMFCSLWISFALLLHCTRTFVANSEKFKTLWRDNRKHFEILRRMVDADDMGEMMKEKINNVMEDLKDGKFLSEASKSAIAKKQTSMAAAVKSKPLSSNESGNEDHDDLHQQIKEAAMHNADLVVVADSDDIEIFEVLGQGSSGVVYRGIFNDQEVAIKQLLPKTLDDDSIKRFHDEIKLMAHIRHPNIVRMIGCSFDPLRLCLIVEYCAKETLGALLSETAGLNQWMGRKIVFARKIAAGMHYLHHMSPVVIHRDLKLSNILLNAEFDLKISDFGEACKLDESRKDYGTMTCVGTPWYVSPENFRGDFYDEKTDVYSFAICLVAIHMDDQLETFFFGEKKRSGLVAANRIAKDWRPKLGYGIPKVIGTLVQKCWDGKPFNRPSFDEIMNVLDHITNDDLADVVVREADGKKVQTKKVYKKDVRSGEGAMQLDSSFAGGDGNFAFSSNIDSSSIFCEDEEDETNFECLENAKLDISMPQWSFLHKSNDFEVMTNPFLESPLLQIKSTTTVRKKPAASIFNFLSDIVLTKQDVKCPHCRWISKNSHGGILYQVRKMPFPLSNRDACMNIRFAAFGRSEFLIYGYSVNDNRVPVYSNFVRMEYNLFYIHIEESRAGECQVTFGCTLDLNGRIPGVLYEQVRKHLLLREEVYLKEFEISAMKANSRGSTKLTGSKISSSRSSKRPKGRLDGSNRASSERSFHTDRNNLAEPKQNSYRSMKNIVPVSSVDVFGGGQRFDATAEEEKREGIAFHEDGPDKRRSSVPEKSLNDAQTRLASEPEAQIFSNNSFTTRGMNISMLLESLPSSESEGEDVDT